MAGPLAAGHRRPVGPKGPKDSGPRATAKASARKLCRRSPAQPLSPPSIASRMPLRRGVARPGPGEGPGGAGPSRPGVSNLDGSVQPGVSDSDDSGVLGSRSGSVVRGALGRPDPDRATRMFRRERGRQRIRRSYPTSKCFCGPPLDTHPHLDAKASGGGG